MSVVFNQFGDLERGALRPGNVHSADGWRDVLDAVGPAIGATFRASTSAPTQPSPCRGWSTSTWKRKRITYAIRLPANRVLQERIGHLLKRSVGQLPTHAGDARADQGDDDVNVQTVRQERLDTMIGMADPMMIKMDVEGYEEEVLKGAEVVLTRGSLKCLILETVTPAVRGMLREAGFQRAYYHPLTRKLEHQPTDLPSNDSIFVRDWPFVAERPENGEKNSCFRADHFGIPGTGLSYSANTPWKQPERKMRQPGQGSSGGSNGGNALLASFERMVQSHANAAWRLVARS
jgi:hypothetical protein